MTNKAERFTKPMDPIAVSPSEAARISGIGRTSLYSALSSGDLKSFKIGTRRLITVDAIRAWIRAQEATPGERG